MIWGKGFLFSLFVVLVCLCSSFQSMHAIQDVTVLTEEEILDQSQQDDPFEQTFHSNIMLAQSFVPSQTPLTKIELKIHKPRRTDDGIFVSIRKDLNGSDLSSRIIPGGSIPFFTYWIEVDISDIDVDPGQKYFIIVASTTPSETPYRWMYDYAEDVDPYMQGRMYRSADDGDTWLPIETDFDFVDATFRTYTYKSKVDLVCNGFLNWTANVSGNQSEHMLLTGSFSIENQGTPFSRLDWKIVHWPVWGTWEFSMMNDTGLRPEDGAQIIAVSVEGPHRNVPDTYTGRILIENIHDENDTCSIDAQLVTSKSKQRSDPVMFWVDLFRQFFHLNWFFLPFL